jgi:leukotriene-A4 hydrolase
MKYFILFTILCLFGQCKFIDPNTFSNYQEVKLNHLHIEWILNLDDKYINASSIYDFTVV